MFELPEAKRVRREDLGDSDQSDVDEDDTLENDAAMQARVNAQIAAALGLDDTDDDEPPVSTELIETKTDNSAQRTNATQIDGEEDPEGEQGYEFNLFSTGGPGGSAKPGKVILEDPTKSLGDGAFVRPRSMSFYTNKALSAKEKEQYSYAAVTGDEIVRLSTQPSWGMAMPWKAISISATRTKKAGDKSVDVLTENMEEEAAKRKRPGKRQRILMRQRKRTKAQVVEEAAKKEAEKEEHLKDKKKRLNRIKKLRKRAKEKEKKLAAGGEADAADTTSDSDGDE